VIIFGLRFMEENPFPTPAINKSARNPKRFLFLLAGFALLLIIIFAGTRLIGGDKEKNIAPTPTPTEFLIPTDTPVPSEEEATPTPKPKSTSTPTPKASVSPIDPATGLDRSKLSVEVQNGSGVEGVAGKAADLLKNLGYSIASTGNADNFDYSNATIQVKSSKASYLPLLKTDLSSDYNIGASSSDLSATSSADALVIIGK